MSTTPAEPQTAAPPAADSVGNAAILNRLKEIEAANQALQATIDNMKSDSQTKEEKIKALSADKRKDMEQMIETAIDNWLNSLTGVQEDVRKQFRHGISKIAEQADMKNAAWEIVCNASEAHNRNVKQIETLINTCAEQGKTIESLLGSDPSFAHDASRMAGVKRTRVEEPPAAAAPKPEGDAWDLFSNMMKEDTKSLYY